MEHSLVIPTACKLVDHKGLFHNCKGKHCTGAALGEVPQVLQVVVHLQLQIM